MKTSMRSRLARVMCLALTLCLMAAFSVPAFAAEANADVMEARNGVVQVQLWFVDPETATESYLQYGSGFLINDNTVVTAEHVVNGLSDDFFVAWADKYNAEHEAKRSAEQI